MDHASAIVLGAGIGALAGITGGMLASWRQTQLEREKWLRGRDDVLANELRVSLQQLTVKLAGAMHSMCWLTWLAKQAPQRLTENRITEYDNEMHELLPQITGLHAMVAALDRASFDRLSGLVERVLVADERIGRASLEFMTGSSDSATALAACFEETMLLERTIPQVVADVISPKTQSSQARPNPQR